MQEQKHSTWHRQRLSRWTWGLVVVIGILASVGHLSPAHAQHPARRTAAPPAAVSKPKPSTPPEKKQKTWHPRHMVKAWNTRYRGAIYQVVQLPRCEHLETIIAYDPSGETFQQAKRRFNGVAVMSGSFHNPFSYSLADFLQRDGMILSAATTGRHFLVIDERGIPSISGDYPRYKGKSKVSMITLGQRLVPLEYDGFSTAFMNRVTDRVALGMNANYLFIVRAKTTIWHVAAFLRDRLPCDTAINSDGGHVVRGIAPVHIVFRWRAGS